MASLNEAPKTAERIKRDGLGDIAYYEVLYKGNFSQDKANGDRADDAWSKLSEILTLAGLKCELKLPITRLSHVTHNEEAKKIQPTELRQDSYIFKANPKLGKKYSDPNGTFILNSISDDEVTKIESYENVFPGKLSWWGLNVYEWYDQDPTGKQVHEAAYNLSENHKCYVSNFLQPEPVSQYGTNSFTMNFSDLLDSYKDARDSLAKICLRVGGTLRYRYEICYTIIVCLKSDEGLEDYPLIKCNEGNPFLPNGLVNDQGEVQLQDDYSQVVPEFKIQYAVKAAVRPKPDYFCWESIAFALYFPENFDKPGEIEIESHKVKHSKMAHIAKNCHIAQYCHRCRKRQKCPDVPHECTRRRS